MWRFGSGSQGLHRLWRCGVLLSRQVTSKRIAERNQILSLRGVTMVSFNLGLEAWQLAIVATFLPVAYLSRCSWLYRPSR
jgi:hypothetical protein